jgi:hypothetical protein
LIFEILIVFVVLAFFAVATEKLRGVFFKYFYALICIILILVAGLRNGDSMPDYLTYVGLYKQVISENFTYFIEISFILIAKFSNRIIPDNFLLLFFIYAIIGVIVKSYAISKLSKFWLYSLLVYVSNYFILQEMIQIRSGIATGFILISIIPLHRRNFLSFVSLILAASFFHYSSIFFFFLWFIDSEKFSVKFYFGLILLSYFMSFTGFDPITIIINFLPIELINLKLDYFEKERAEELRINVLGLFILTRLIILIYFTYFRNTAIRFNEHFILFLKLYSFGIISYIGLSKYPEIAVRISYIFLATEIFIVPSFIYTINKKGLARFIVICYSLMALILNIIFTSYFKWEQYF